MPYHHDSLVAVVGFVAIALLIMFLIGLVLYFLPSIVAFNRHKANKIPILALNFFLGWSLVGWVVSLVWALSNDAPPVVVHQTFLNDAPAPERLATQYQSPREF